MPIGAHQKLCGIDDAAVEQGGERGRDVFENLPNVRAVELAAAVGAAGTIDSAGQQAVEVFDAAAEEGAVIEEGVFAGAERDAAIDFAEQGRGLEFVETGGDRAGIEIGGEGELIGVEEGDAVTLEAEPGGNLIGG